MDIDIEYIKFLLQSGISDLIDEEDTIEHFNKEVCDKLQRVQLLNEFLVIDLIDSSMIYRLIDGQIISYSISPGTGVDKEESQLLIQMFRDINLNLLGI